MKKRTAASPRKVEHAQRPQPVSAAAAAVFYFWNFPAAVAVAAAGEHVRQQRQPRVTCVTHNQTRPTQKQTEPQQASRATKVAP